MSRPPATRARTRTLQRALKPSETAIHTQVVGFLRRAWPDDLMFWHTPNGGRRDHVLRTKRDGTVVRYSPEAQKLKAMGVLPGIPDLLFTLPNGQLAGIELKNDEGELSEDQIKIRDKMLALKCGFAEARSLEEVETVLSGWLALFGRKLGLDGEEGGMMGLTPVQSNALAYISHCIAENGVAPSYSEIGTALGLVSKSGVARLVNSLEERGVIRRLHSRARAIEVVGQVDILPRLPGLSTPALLSIRDRINIILSKRVT